MVTRSLGRLGSEADIIRDVALIRLAAISSGLASVANGYPYRESQVVPRAPYSRTRSNRSSAGNAYSNSLKPS
jgi:hypothetical protein